jgi:hypothetical protein
MARSAAGSPFVLVEDPQRPQVSRETTARTTCKASSLLAQNVEERLPRAHGFSILAGQLLGDLPDVVQIVRHPRRQQLAQSDDPSSGCLPLQILCEAPLILKTPLRRFLAPPPVALNRLARGALSRGRRAR